LGASGAKLAAFSAAAVVLTAAAVFAFRELARPTTTVPARTQVAGASASAPHPTTQPAPAPVPATVPVPGPVPAAAEARPPSAAPAGARAPAPDQALQREVAQLGRIKQLLAGDPRQAYRLAQAGHREFRAGMLRHEREGLAILALWQLGRDREAQTRARAFLARYPESPLREQLTQRLERAAPRTAQEP
jgi:hypothetical protein